MYNPPFQHHEGPYTVAIEETGKGEVSAFIKEGDTDDALTLASVNFVGNNPSYTAALFATAPEFYRVAYLLLTRDGNISDIVVAIELARQAMVKYDKEANK
jgi:hypothetical protein